MFERLESVVRVIAISALFLVLLVPLVRADGLFFPFITGKAFLFRALVGISFFSVLALIFFNKRFIPNKGVLLYVLTALMAVLFLSTVFGADPYRSFWSNFERMEGLVMHLYLFAFFLALVSLCNTKKLWDRFFHVSLGVSVVVGILALLQFLGVLSLFQSSARLESTFGNATYLAVYLLFHIFIVLFYLFQEYKIPLSFKVRIAYVTIIAFEVIILMLTETRGAILGLLGGAFLIALLNSVWGGGNAKKYARIAVIVFLGMVFIFALVRNQDFVKETRVLGRLSSISLEETTVESRLSIWTMALQGFRERPILGWGPENFNLIFSKYYDTALYDQEQWFDRAHNVLLDWLTSTGVVGLLLYLSLFAAAIFCLMRDKIGNTTFAARSALVGLLAAYFFHNLFVFDNIGSYIMFFSVLAFIHKNSTHGKEKDFSTAWPSRKAAPVVLSVCIALLLFTSYHTTAKPLLASRSLLLAVQPSSDGGAWYNLEKFNETLSYNTFGTQEAREQILRTSLQVAQSPNVSDTVKNTFLTTAYTEMKTQVEQNPNNTRSLFFLGSFLARLNQLDEALFYLEKSQGLSPSKQTIFFERANVHFRKNEFQKAVELLEDAYMLEPENSEAAVLYGVGLIVSGHSNEAEILFDNQFGTSLVPDARIADAYERIGKIEKAEEIRALLEK